MPSNQQVQGPYPRPRPNHLRLTIRHLYTDRWIVLEVPETMRIGEVKLQALQKILPRRTSSGPRDGVQRETLQVSVATQRKQATSVVPSASMHGCTWQAEGANSAIRGQTGPPEQASFPVQEPSSPFVLDGGFSETVRTPPSSDKSSIPADLSMQSLFDETSSFAHEVFPDSTSSFSTGSQISLPRTAEEEEYYRPNSPPPMPYETEAFQGTSFPTSGRRSSVAVAAMLARGDDRSPTAKLSGAVKALPSKVTRSRSRTVPQKDQSGLFGCSDRKSKWEQEVWSADRHRLVSAVLGCHSDDAALVSRKLKQYDLLMLLPQGIQFDPPLSQYPQAFLFIENVLVSKSPVDTMPGLRHLMSNSSKWKWSSRSLMVCEGQLQVSKLWRAQGPMIEFTGSLPALAVKSQELAPPGTRSTSSFQFIVVFRFGDGRSLILSPTSYADYVNLMRVTGEDGNEFLEPSDSLEFRFNAINLAYASHHGGLSMSPSPTRAISIGSALSDTNRSERRSTKPRPSNLPLAITTGPSTETFRFPTSAQPRVISDGSPQETISPEAIDSDAKDRPRRQTLPLHQGKDDEVDRLRATLSSTTTWSTSSSGTPATPSPPRSERERERERNLDPLVETTSSSTSSPAGGGVDWARSLTRRRNHRSSCSIDSTIERPVTAQAREAMSLIDRRTPLSNEWMILMKQTAREEAKGRGDSNSELMEPNSSSKTITAPTNSSEEGGAAHSAPPSIPEHDSDDDDDQDELLLVQAMRKKSIIFDRNEEILRQQALSSRSAKSLAMVARRPTTVRSSLGPIAGVPFGGAGAGGA
ncbi:BQ2448_5993 [Microbotryum intermedium]|uniref:BQ2448_5993 protein n=1 Tax=Microbotryum intermedium TaxID=269621 RepID=A0A238F2R9_9BASI|nr:BQ2448_5993 [Microbotryum intermedium]